MPSVIRMLRICDMVHLSIYAFFYCIALLNKYMQVLGKKKQQNKTPREFYYVFILGKECITFLGIPFILYSSNYFYGFLLLLQLFSDKTLTNSLKSTYNTGLIKLHFLSKNYLLNKSLALVSTYKHS